MKYYLVTFKNGLQNPTKLCAKNEEMAYKEAFAYHLKNSGFVEHVQLKIKAEDVVDTVKEIA